MYKKSFLMYINDMTLKKHDKTSFSQITSKRFLLQQ